VMAARLCGLASRAAEAASYIRSRRSRSSLPEVFGRLLDDRLQSPLDGLPGAGLGGVPHLVRDGLVAQSLGPQLGGLGVTAGGVGGPGVLATSVTDCSVGVMFSVLGLVHDAGR
jgi:hypothetical protein